MKRKPLGIKQDISGSFTNISRGRLQWTTSKVPNFSTSKGKDIFVMLQSIKALG